MKIEQLSKIVELARCKIVGWEDAGNDGHRLALAALIQTFDSTESALLCEPSLARKTTRPPDIVLIDPEIGVHVFEIKAVDLDRIEAIEAGGQLRIRYASGVTTRSPIVQVRNAMFDIKDATVRALDCEVNIPFEYWVVFPSIQRQAWFDRFGPHAFCPGEFLFADELRPELLERFPPAPSAICRSLLFSVDGILHGPSGTRRGDLQKERLVGPHGRAPRRQRVVGPPADPARA